MPKNFYDPPAEVFDVLNAREWVCSYSGGKDSTALVTWIEWMRRTGWVSSLHPRLVLSDTGVEYPFLREITGAMMGLLRGCGWHCEVVAPALGKRLYNQIFGRGVCPVHPALGAMRWCTRGTKIDPMTAWAKTLGDDVLKLTGVRFGESSRRDQALRSYAGCGASGECGLPVPKGDGDRSLFAPIVNWRTCQVLDWLQGSVGGQVRRVMADVYELTGRLIHAYGMKVRPPGFGIAPPEVTALRFGCIGCPAVEKDKVLDHAAAEDPRWSQVRRLYGIWERARAFKNRCKKPRPPGSKRRRKIIVGPLKMAVRQILYEEFLDVQQKSGVQLVTPEDDAYIRRCWEDKVYPRGWSEADEGFRP